MDHYYEIHAGIGVHKSPELYGAFPTDPYSHTPAGKGAQQPGMTGQVKEDIINRFGELGVSVHKGQIQFFPCLLRKREFLKDNRLFQYIDVHQNKKEIELHENSLGFTYCQVPIVYTIGDANSIEVKYINSNDFKIFKTLVIDPDVSKSIFRREGNIVQISVTINPDILK